MGWFEDLLIDPLGIRDYVSGGNDAPPAATTYGGGMAETLKTQTDFLKGTGEFADIGSLESLLPLEESIRKKTAQTDTDILRQTLLGGDKTSQVKQNEDGSFFVPNAKVFPASEGKRYQQIEIDKGRKATSYNDGATWQEKLNGKSPSFAILDTKTGGITGRQGGKLTQLNDQGIEYTYDPEADEQWQKTSENDTNNLKEVGKIYTDIETKISDAGGDEDISLDEYSFLRPTTRKGDGMVDLIGDTRNVQESRKLSKDEQGERLVEDNPELDQLYQQAQNDPANPYNGLSKAEAGRKLLADNGGDLGKIGQAFDIQNLTLPEFAKVDAGRKAGFDAEGNFLGASVLVEDIGRGGQMRAREADIADVERLGDRATDAYRAQGDLSGALEQARSIGSGGDAELSAIPSDPLFTGEAIKSLAEKTALQNASIDEIRGGRTGDFDPIGSQLGSQNLVENSAQLTQLFNDAQADPNNPFRGLSKAQASQKLLQDYGGDIAKISETFGVTDLQPQASTDVFRSALMQDGMNALGQGLTSREERQISEAARARSTMMGRTFDQSGAIAEAEARVAEDNQRRMQNRAYAQQALGQEVGIQQADMARGLQAQQLNLGRQTEGVNRLLTAEEKDIERRMRQQAMQEQYRQQGLGMERANAAQMVGLEQATSADPFQAILQRQGQNNLAGGGQVFGQAGYGLNSSPQYLTPESGLGFIQNQNTNLMDMYNANTAADAERFSGLVQAGATAAVAACWVAREVYGEHNPAWLLFRSWMLNDSPSLFRKAYLRFGERFANFISDKPRLKARIRTWMDSKIGR